MSTENNNPNNIDSTEAVKPKEETVQSSGEPVVTPEVPVVPVVPVVKTTPGTQEGYDRKPRYEKKYPPRHGGNESSGDHRKSEHKPDLAPRMPKFKKKLCRFCIDKDLKIDYKSSEIVGRFITDRGKILPRRVTGTCARHQRELSTAIKRARHIALIPYLEK